MTNVFLNNQDFDFPFSLSCYMRKQKEVSPFVFFTSALNWMNLSNEEGKDFDGQTWLEDKKKDPNTSMESPNGEAKV